MILVHTISATAKKIASRLRFGTRTAVWCLVLHRKLRSTTASNQIGDQQGPSTRSYRSISGPTSVLPVRLNQSSCFAFFESSIMCKIGPGSRLGCRACCVSGKALSEGGFIFNTRLVYFVSEQVFPSGAWFKSALPLYLHANGRPARIPTPLATGPISYEPVKQIPT